MAIFETGFDIGDAVDFGGREATVRGVTIGSDRAVYYTVEWVKASEDGATTYDSSTVPAASVAAPQPPAQE